MEADKSVGDTVMESKTIYQPSRCVEQTGDGAADRQEDQPTLHYRNPAWNEPARPPETGMWPQALSVESDVVDIVLQSRETVLVTCVRIDRSQSMKMPRFRLADSTTREQWRRYAMRHVYGALGHVPPRLPAI